MLPGPIVTLIGRANILSKRVRAANDERTNFEALATFDGNSDTFDLAVSAHYEIPIVLEIEGTAALHAGPDGWYSRLANLHMINEFARAFSICLRRTPTSLSVTMDC
jgi:hypothetical protein